MSVNIVQLEQTLDSEGRRTMSAGFLCDWHVSHVDGMIV